MAGSALFTQAINSITKFRITDSKPIIDGWLTKPAESNCDVDLPSKHSRLEVIHETTEEDEQEAPALLQAQSQQETMKVTQFSRPPSRHEDPFDGFTFTKPKIPQMNFSRKSLDTTSISMDPKSPQQLPTAQAIKLSNSSATSPGFIEEPESAASVYNTTRNIGDGASHKPSLIVDQSIQSISENCETSDAVDETSGTSRVAQTSSDTDTIVNSVTPSQDIRFIDQVSPKITQNAFQSVVGDITNDTTSLKSKNPQKTVNEVSRKPRTVEESKTQSTSRSADSKTSLNEEELLGALLLHHRREQQKKEVLKASQHAKDLELEDLREVSNDLYQQLHYAREHIKVKEIELSKFYSTVPQWEAKVQRLKEHVQNLITDHQELRKGADELQKRHEDIRTENLVLNTDVQEVRESMDHHQSKTTDILREAKHQIQVLEQTIDNKDIQMQEDGELLDAERARSQRLENEMAEITKSNQGLAKLFTGYRDEIANKLNNILEKSECAQIINLPNSKDDLKPLLDQCLQLLRKIQVVETVKPKDLELLSSSVRIYAHGLTQSMQSCGRTSEMTRDCQRNMSLDLQQQLQALKSSVKAETALNEQLVEVREMKATVRERLQMTESALVEARQHAIVLENKEQLHMQRIHALEVEVAKFSSKEPESVQLNSQVQELMIHNKDLHEQVATCHREANGVSIQLQQKIKEASNLEACINNLQLQLSDARIESTAFEDQRASYESKADEKLEQLRKQLSRSATLEKSRLEGDYLNQIQQLRYEKSVTDDKAEQCKRQLNRLQCEKEETDNLAKERLCLLVEIEAKTKVNDENTSILQTRISELELKVEQDTQHLREAQDELRTASTELKAREAEVLKLTASSVLAIGVDVGPIDADRSDKPKRMVDRGNSVHNVIVEETQDLDNSISSNKIGNEHRETSPVSSLDDLSDLFPATPALVSPGLDSSQNTQLENVAGQGSTHDASARHITFAANTSMDKSPRQLDQTVDQHAERKPPSIPLKASLQLGSALPQGHQLDIVVQPLQSLLRRPTANAKKSDKRTASIAGFDEEMSQSKNFSLTKIRRVGPVIPDSQNSNESRVVTARGRKTPKIAARKATKDDKYARRFSQELN